MFQRKVQAGYTRDRQPLFSPLTLQYFNPGLVAKFRPESLRDDAGTFNDDNYYLTAYAFLQHEDIYRGLEYSERVLIPNLKPEKLPALTSDKLLHYICSIHSHTSAMLSVDYGLPAGEFTPREIMRWHYRHEFSDAMDLVLIGKVPLALLLKEYRLEHLLEPMTKLIQKIKRLKITIPDSSLTLQLLNTKKNDPIYDAKIWQLKLFYGHHQKLFSAEEEALISQFVIICKKPEEMRPAMEAFSEQLCQKLKACDGSESAVIKIAAFAFQQLTSIHCFFNGNGRTATMVANSILIAFDLPCILMRTEDEENDPTSSYCHAINQMDSDITYLEKHIQTKVTEAKKTSLAMARATHRVQLENMADGLIYFYSLLEANHANLKNPAFNLQAVHEKGIKELQDRINNPARIKSIYTGVTFQFAQTPQNTSVDIGDFLKQVSGIEKGWKKNAKNPAEPVFWLEGLDEASADKAAEKLKATFANTVVTANKRKTTGNGYIVLVEHLSSPVIQSLKTEVKTPALN